ncbi:MAG: tetratricopeptide repeat protein [Rhodospirillales bacterium]
MTQHTEGGIFREIDEELRRENYAKLWKRYGKYITAMILGLVVSVAGYQFWRNYDTNTRTALGERFATALNLGEGKDKQAAMDAFAGLSADAGGGYAMLARFQEAALLARNGRRAASVAAYRQLANDGGIDVLYRDLALVLGVIHEMNNPADNADAAELSGSLAPLTADNNPWRHSAMEITALLEERAGNRRQARELFTRLGNDATAPRGVRSRANEMLAAFGQK